MHNHIKEYYGSVLKSSQDLQSNACCTDDVLPLYVKQALADVHPEVAQRYYGCGLVTPALLTGARILDLGCGSGRDCYVLSRLVGEKGLVVGVDMTEEQLAIARTHQEFHRQKYGYHKSNVELHIGYIEQLDQLGLPADFFDIIVSNCVINLSPNKPAVFEQAYRLLKPGGELYFSDIYADRRMPVALSQDPVLYGECLGGALYWNDFELLAKTQGFKDPRLVEHRPIEVGNDSILAQTGLIRFFSATYRLFKLVDLEPACEDYGQAVIYRGTIPYFSHNFRLDKHHNMEKGRIFPVCGNTYRMLHDTRFVEHFDFLGNWDTHYGLFEGCGMGMPFMDENGVGIAPTLAGCC